MNKPLTSNQRIALESVVNRPVERNNVSPSFLDLLRMGYVSQELTMEGVKFTITPAGIAALFPGAVVGRATGGRPRDPLPAKVVSVLEAFKRTDVGGVRPDAPFKRFWLFAAGCYYPLCGMEDFISDADSVAELFQDHAAWLIAQNNGDGALTVGHVYDSWSRKITWQWGRHDMVGWEVQK